MRKLKGKIIDCIICSNKFYVKKSRLKRNPKYCSVKCLAKGYKGRKAWNKGIPFSEESKKNMSKSHIGSKAWNKGLTSDTDDRVKNNATKQGLARRGTKHSIETRMKMSLAQKGEKSYLWRGGLTKSSTAIRNSIIYRIWRESVFKRDKWACVFCGKKGRMEADHIKPFSLILKENKIKSLEEATNCQELWNINNGRTLCLLCYKNTPTYLKRNL